MRRFNQKKLKDAEIREQYWVKISKRFAAFKNQMIAWASTELARKLERIQKSQLKTILSHYERKQHKPWLEEERQKYIEQRNHVIPTEDPSGINAHNPNTLRCESGRHLRNTKEMDVCKGK
jgi:hypothetical protein